MKSTVCWFAVLLFAFFVLCEIRITGSSARSSVLQVCTTRSRTTLYDVLVVERIEFTEDGGLRALVLLEY